MILKILVIYTIIFFSSVSCTFSIKDKKWDDTYFVYNFKSVDKSDLKQKFQFDLYEDPALKYFLFNIENKEEMRMNEAAGSIFNILVDLNIRKFGNSGKYSSAKIINYFKDEKVKGLSSVDTLIVFSNSDSKILIDKLNSSNYPKINDYYNSDRIFERKDFDEYNQENINKCHHQKILEIQQLYNEKYPSGIPENKLNRFNADKYFAFMDCLPWIKRR